MSPIPIVRNMYSTERFCCSAAMAGLSKQLKMPI